MLDQRLGTFVGTLALVAGCSVAAASGQSFDAEAYFSGKTIEVVINSNAGGGQDTSTRLLLNDFSDFVPGNPTFVATNINEVAGITAVYDAPASDDRITIGVTSRASTLYTSTLDPIATHDATKIRVAAGYGVTPTWTVIFNDAAKAYPSIKDAVGKDSPELLFAETVGDPSQIVSSMLSVSWLCDRMDLPCRMVQVADANSNTLAQDVERGDLNMMDLNSVTAARLFAARLVAGDAIALVEYTEEGGSPIGTPYERAAIEDILPDEATKAEYQSLLPLIGYGGAQNVIFAGPNVPAEAVKAIGDAFVTKMSDPEQLAEVAKGRFGNIEGHSVSPTIIGPEDMQRIFDGYVAAFQENQDFYKSIQQELYDRYWN